VDLTFTDDQLAFRDELREWFAANPPGDEPADENEALRWRTDWQRRLNDGGWAGVHWPKEYGGRGASLMETAIFFEELGRSGGPLPVNTLGKDGDEWVVTGQKVWTSGAQYSKWCMLVARTDQEAPKHKGLTYFILDMEQDAVQVRPLVQITGEAEFNELFIEEARIPDENVVGGVGNGWKVALTTLMNERAGLGFFLQVRMRQLLDRLFDEAAATGALDDPRIADKLADLHLRTEILRLTAYRGLSVIEQYGQPGPEGSLVKLMWSETNKQLTQLAADIVGPEALTKDTPWSYELLRARGNSIEGGTTEILKNIVAERVLGLPRAR
jgi:alkylation response protein AidB-like acyl-CoA dehydrogenase